MTVLLVPPRANPSPSSSPYVRGFLPYAQGFLRTMREAGIDFKDELKADGRLHRFSPGRKGNPDGWYVFYGMAGAFGDWKQGIHQTWSVPKDSSSPYQEELQTQIQKAQQQVDEERTRKQEKVAQEAASHWESLSETRHSPYLDRKKVGAFGIRFSGDTVVIPVRDRTGKLWSLQSISPDGTKRFLFGGRKKGCFHLIGQPHPKHSLYVTEGYATGASIHMATDAPVVVAFDAGNLAFVVEELSSVYPKMPPILAGDDDVGKTPNVGRKTAEDVCRKYSCSVVFPIFKTSNAQLTDFNDLHVAEGLEEVKRQLQSSKTTLKALTTRALLSLEIPPREMLLSPILPEQGLTMIHAPRGIGKTHVSLTIAYAVATGGVVFQGKWESPCPRKVLFVDGEMLLVAIQERLAKIVHSTEGVSLEDHNLLFITQDLQERGIADLSTPQGQQTIEEHLKGVKLLILDNYSALCRKGRENEAESWIPLQEWFLTSRRRGVSVLLIHHSNKVGAQRGTSRKEDLLDTIITLKKPEGYDPREGARFEVHYEKARGFYGEEAAPFEASLGEEKGKFVWRIQTIEHMQDTQILSLYKENFTQREIAQELGMGLGTVNRKLREAKEKGLLGETND